jgi:hypothetical protein
MKQQLLHKLLSAASVLCTASWIATAAVSYAGVPETALLVDPTVPSSSMTIKLKTGGSSHPASLGDVMRHGQVLSVPNDGTGARTTLRFRDQSGGDMKLKVDAIARNGLTRYYMPCKTILSGNSTAVITWENGRGRGCEKGINVTSRGRTISQGPILKTQSLARKDNPRLEMGLFRSPDSTQASNDFFQPNLVREVSSVFSPNWSDENEIILLSESSPNTSRWEAQTPLEMVDSSADIRYYCSTLPASGGGSAGMAAGFNSEEEACKQATEKCLKNNSGNDCSIQTMGEWSINDPELISSITCKNRKSSYKKLRGADISDPSSSGINEILKDALEKTLGPLGDILSGVLKLKPGTCVLEVYHPEDIVISPVTSEQTVVEAVDNGNGTVIVTIQEGQALLRSTQSPTGFVANPGETYVFNGEGAINNQGRIRR